MSRTASFAHAEFDVLARSALALAGVEPDVGHEFFRSFKAAHVANNGQEREGVDQAHASTLMAAQHHGLRAHFEPPWRRNKQSALEMGLPSRVGVR